MDYDSGQDALWAKLQNKQGTIVDFLRDEYLGARDPVPTGLAELDELLGGGMRPGLYVLGGEPGAGKSALALQVAFRASWCGRRVLYASLEMGRGQCVMRLLSHLSSEECSRADGKGAFEWSEAWRLARPAREAMREARRECGEVEALARLAGGADPVATAAAEFSRRCPGLLVAAGSQVREARPLRELAGDAVKAGASLVVVDCLQLLGCEGAADEYARVSAASAALNALGNDCGVPVLAIASVNRASAKEGPSMHGYRGSGQIEFDANAAMTLVAEDRPAPAGLKPVALHVTKNRWGALTGPGGLRLLLDGAHNRLEERE